MPIAGGEAGTAPGLMLDGAVEFDVETGSIRLGLEFGLSRRVLKATDPTSEHIPPLGRIGVGCREIARHFGAELVAVGLQPPAHRPAAVGMLWPVRRLLAGVASPAGLLKRSGFGIQT